jgi:hypothetical protein
MGKKIQTDFLFAQPSFASGAGSVIDLWGQLAAYNTSATPMDADALAIFSDWAIVGQDISEASEKCLEECEAG